MVHFYPIHDIMNMYNISRRTAYRAAERLRSIDPESVRTDSGKLMINPQRLHEVLPPPRYLTGSVGNPWLHDPAYQRRLRARRKDVHA